MLDLSLIKESYLEIKLPNGDILNLLKCNQGMLGSVIEMSQKMQGDTTSIELLGELFKFATKVINRNKENKIYKQKEIEEMLSLDIAMMLIEAYVGWTSEVLHAKN